MIFNSVKDIQNDIYIKISSFLKDNINNKDIKNIISLLRSYLMELKNIREIDNYQTEIENKTTIIVQILKGTDNCFFTIDLDLEVRRLKINKIKSTDISIKMFLENKS
jgi:hypothetical protein